MIGESLLAGVIGRRLPRDCLIVLNFHRVGEGLPPWHFGSTPRQFERVATTFARFARPVRLDEVAAGGIRGRMLALTFDDGFADGLEVVAPLLERLGLPGAFFLTAGCVEEGRVPWPDEAYARLLALPGQRLVRLARALAPGRPAATRLEAAHSAVHGLKYATPVRRARVLAALPQAAVDAGRLLSWEEARALAERGLEVGAHGLTHAPLPALDEEALGGELAGARDLLARRLDRPVDLLAYPDNQADERVAAAAATAGYRLALAGGESINAPGADPLRLARLRGEDPSVLAMAARAWRGPRRTLAFSEEAEHYGEERGREYSFRTQARWVAELLGPKCPARVLDAGCGTGSLLPELRAAGARTVVGVDAEAAMVAAAAAIRPEERWLHADVSRLPLASGSFDAVTALGVLEYVDSPVEALRELARVAAPGAPVLVSVPQRWSPNTLAFGVLELLRPWSRREGSSPLGRRSLARAAARAGLEVERICATNFFAFPFTMLAPRTSEHVAEALRPLGRVPGLRGLGAQLLLEARRPADESVFWLPPSLPTSTTFLDRELEALRAAGAPVVPVTADLAPGAALAMALRRPFTTLRLALELQRLKAPRDRERGRVGYVVLLLRGLSLAWRLRRRPGWLHATFADGVGTIAYCTSALAGLRYSFTAHSPYSLWQGSRLLARQALAADAVVCETRGIERRLLELAPGARTRVIRSPAPRSAPSRSLVGPPYELVCVARLVPHKGFATAIQGVARAREAGTPVSLEVLGDGPERAALERVAAGVPAGTVRFTGSVSNEVVLERLASALAMLAPCEVQPDGDRDGLPVSIVDAAACGVATIATPVSSIGEVVVDGVTGLLVPERDPDAIARAVARLAADPELALRLGEAARELCARRHDPDREARRLLALWGLCGAAAQPAAGRRSGSASRTVSRN